MLIPVVTEKLTAPVVGVRTVPAPIRSVPQAKLYGTDCVRPGLNCIIPVHVTALASVHTALNVRLFHDMLADGELSVHADSNVTVEPEVVIVPLDHSSVDVPNPTDPDTVTPPASVTLLLTTPVVQPVDCQVPPLSVIVRPVMMPVALVSSPAQVISDVARVSVAPEATVSAPASVGADVRVSVAVAVAFIPPHDILAEGVFSVKLAPKFSIDPANVITPLDHAIVPVR